MPPSTGTDRDSRVGRSLRNESPRSAEKLSPSPSKKQKREDNARAPSTPLRAQVSRPDTMYTFTSNVIDLTSSPNSTPNGKAAARRAANGIRTTNDTATAGPKKLVVKNFRTTTKSDPEQHFSTTWKELEDALDIIFSKDVKPFSMEHLYRGVENICRQDKAPQLFQRLYTKCRSAIQQVKESLITSMQGKSDVEALGMVVEAWTSWRRQMTTIRSIFYYLDRSYLLHSQKHPSLEDSGIQEFKDNVFLDAMLQDKILNGACELVSQDRGQTARGGFASTLFKDAIGMFHVLTVYTKNFEPLLLEKSERFFDSWAQENSKSLSLTEYVSQCHALFSAEIARCESFALDESTKRNLISLMETSLVEAQQSRLTETIGVIELLNENHQEVLKALYQLLEMKKLGGRLEAPFVQYIQSEGESIVFDEKREGEMVLRLLQFKKKLDIIVEKSFYRDDNLGAALRQAFETFINKTKKSNTNWGTNNDKPGEMIAKYVDLILKGGSKAIPELGAASSVPNEEEIDDNEADEDSQINQQLDQVLDLFRFVNGKAVFEAFYQKDLAKRLLMNRSASADAEKSMLDRLSKTCGSGFTSNLETMFKDMELAREENASYRMMLEESGRKPPVDLNVNVLSASAWPTYPSIDVEIPRAVQQATAAFETHYKAKHNGRRLEWKHSLAHCQIKARFPAGNKDLVVSSFQAIVMLYFNSKPDNEAITYAELSAATKLPDPELQRTLQSLACAKYRVLTKSTKGKDINTTDKFMVNLSFKESRTRIKINQIQLKETKEENKQTHERVAADRQYETQAAIVRIMKGKKKVKHALLVAEVIDALKSRGAVNAEDIKKQIEKLIDKDYMERGDDGFYEYVA